MDLKRLTAYYYQVDHPETHRSILSWLMIVENIISFVCGLPWGKTEFWIMLENFGFEWIFLEPTRWKWLNMEIFKLSFSNWLLPDKELRGNTEIEGENDQRISGFAKCNVELSFCQYFPANNKPIDQANQGIRIMERGETIIAILLTIPAIPDHKTSKA